AGVTERKRDRVDPVQNRVFDPGADRDTRIVASDPDVDLWPAALVRARAHDLEDARLRLDERDAARDQIVLVGGRNPPDATGRHDALDALALVGRGELDVGR